MTKAWPLIMCGVVGAFGLAVMTAEKAPEDYSKAMKEIGAAMQNVTKAAQAEDFDTVTKHATTIIDAFPVVDKYWAGKTQAQDAQKFTQTARKSAADLRVAAGLKSGEGVAYSAKELLDACTGCHNAHRERLPDGSFEIK